jgi:hypothetical protein
MLPMTIPRNNTNVGWIIRVKLYIRFVPKSFMGNWLSAKLGCVCVCIYIYIYIYSYVYVRVYVFVCARNKNVRSETSSLPQPLNSPYHKHLPYQLSAESVDLCGKKRISNLLEQKFPGADTKDFAVRVDPLS